MRVIRLNGKLGKRFGRVHRLDVRTPAEAIRALCAILDGFQQFLATSHEKGVAYRCAVDRDPLVEDQIHYPMSRSFSITPVVHGAGKTLGIVLGVALIAASVFMPAFTPVFSALGSTFGFSAAATMWLGVALTLGGVAQLLAPTPKSMDPSSGTRQENAYFNGPVNTTAQGNPVPFGYGRMIVGSAVVSASISIEQKSTPNFDYDYPIGGYAIP
jgi:predicted phage tail protein